MPCTLIRRPVEAGAPNASSARICIFCSASVPLATAQVEAFELTETGDGTHVRWTLALEPRLLGRVSAPLAARTIPRLFRRAMDNLGTYVHGAR